MNTLSLGKMNLKRRIEKMINGELFSKKDNFQSDLVIKIFTDGGSRGNEIGTGAGAIAG